MKKTTCIAITTALLFLSINANAIPGKKALDRDCTAGKAAKNTALKASFGVGGPCDPADAAKDTTKKAVGLYEKKHKKRNLC